MNEFYLWLYEHYAAPQFQAREAEFPLFYQEQKRELLEVTHGLSNRERLLSAGPQSSLACCWGTAAFTYGVHVGQMLSTGLSADLPEQC